MLNMDAMKAFKILRNPFVNDVVDLKDIFLSEDHLFLKEMMLDTARYAGFTAVYGEVGSGKSVMRKAVVTELINEGIKVIFPIIVDKSRITPTSLIDAVIMDISDELPKRSLEMKTRQALKVLQNRASSGLKQVLIIEEAHLLDVKAMKALKQIYELEDGFKKLVGIILIGQPELQFLLDESKRPEMREVIRRITTASISGLGNDIERYLAQKFSRVKRKSEDIFEKDAFEAMQKRMTTKTSNGISISTAYPLTVNNFTTKLLNLATQMGETKITADLVLNA